MRSLNYGVELTDMVLPTHMISTIELCNSLFCYCANFYKFMVMVNV